MIEDIEAEHLLADKGYDSNEVVEAALALGMNPVIPPRSNRKTPRVYDRRLWLCTKIAISSQFLCMGLNYCAVNESARRPSGYFES